jgi:protein TonB
MFEDFDGKGGRKDQRRFWMSMAGSLVLYGGLAFTVVAASAAARVAPQEEEAVEIDFTPPPEPEPAPPPPPPTPTPKPPPVAAPKTQRAELEVPQEVPDEKPEESDKPLADAQPSEAGKDGFTNGAAGGTGSAPAPAPVAPAPVAPAVVNGPVQLPENATPAVASPDNKKAEFPEEALKAGIQDVVIAKIVIKADGSVGAVTILRGNPIFHEVVKAMLMSWHYDPAKLPDGTPISVFKIIQIPFRLENMN